MLAIILIASDCRSFIVQQSNGSVMCTSVWGGKVIDWCLLFIFQVFKSTLDVVEIDAAAVDATVTVRRTVVRYVRVVDIVHGIGAATNRIANAGGRGCRRRCKTFGLAWWFLWW